MINKLKAKSVAARAGGRWADLRPRDESDSYSKGHHEIGGHQADRLDQWTQDRYLSRSCVLHQPQGKCAGRRCHGLAGGYRDRKIAGKPVLRDPAVCTRPHPFKKSRGYRRGKRQPLTTIYVAFMLHGAAESDWKSLGSTRHQGQIANSSTQSTADNFLTALAA